MEEAEVCRRAARKAVEDIDPPGLRAAMDEVIRNGSMTPGALALSSARVATSNDGDGDTDLPDHVVRRAAGVQLIYEGLGLIRELTHEDPWGGVVTTDPDPDDPDLTDDDLAVVAADVLVARGFYLLARTDAAGKAVETVRNFGRDQTLSGSGEDPECTLEADVCELAVIAGVTAYGGDPSPEILSAVADLASPDGTPLPPAETALAEADLHGFEVGVDTADGAARSSVTDP